MLQTRQDNALQVYVDTISSYRSINAANRPQIDVYNIKTYSELIRLHDACVEIKRIEEAELRRLWSMQEAESQKVLEKKMEKLDKERIKWNYSDDKFSIRLPSKLSEIVSEGSLLHHCVGGYTQRHASGETTIMFLRKNSEPDISFYTIEVRNNNIVQIHGFGNKWLGNNPEAIPTVMRWLRANQFTCSDQILLSTAKGYSSGNAPLVAKPKI